MSNLLTRITRPLFRSKAEFQAFITGRSGPTRAQAMHAGVQAPSAAVSATAPASKPSRAQLAAAAKARTKAREDALCAKVSAAIGTKRPNASSDQEGA